MFDRRSRLYACVWAVHIPAETPTDLFIPTVKMDVNKPRNRWDSWVYGVHIIFVPQWCVRTPVIIQFGVSYLQAGVGAKWVQIM